MKSKIALLVAGACVALANPAFAQNSNLNPNPGPEDDQDQGITLTPVEQFGGLHVEITAGFDHLADTSYKTISTTLLTQTQGTGQGVSYGGAIGYDVPVTNRWTIGGELGIYGSTAKWNNAPNLVTGTFDTATVKPSVDIFGGVKVGYVLNAKTELFAKGGYVSGQFSVSGSDGSEVLKETVTASGYRAGVGIVRAVTKTTYIKLEYDYSHYGSSAFAYNNATPDASSFDLRAVRQQAKASFGFWF